MHASLADTIVRHAVRTHGGRWLLGDRVGRYVVGTPVGRGAMGEVFRAHDTELARSVALKRLHTAQTSDARARLVREARAAAQLQHPNVVAVYEVVDDVLATEWIDGVTLRVWLASSSRPWREVVDVVAGAGRGLAAAHAAGIVHRDFKPENVLVDRRGRARVADFGLASAFDVAEGASIGPLTPLRVTMTGTVAGTPAYMAPELIDGARPDARSDQFAFAVTLFEAVTGTYPFAGKTAEAIWAQMTAGVFAKHDARIPTWLDRVLRKALSADPANRFASMDELLDLIERRSRRGIGIPIVAAGALGGIVVAGVALLLAPSEIKCGDELVDEVWSQPVRAQIAQQFTAVAPTRAIASLAFNEQRLDHWAGAWKLGRRAACSAEPSQRRARTTCLDRQLGELRAQLAVWSRADANVVDRSAAAIASLPAPEECTAATALSATPASTSFMDAIAEIEALRRAGKLVEAHTKIARVVDAASTQTDELARARAFHAFAAVENELHEHASARTHLASATQAARRTSDTALLAEILTLDATVRVDSDRPAEAIGVLDTIDTVSLRASVASHIEAVRANALARLDRTDEAIAAHRHSIAILEPEAARDPSLRLRVAGRIGSLGSTLGRAGHTEEGIAEMKRGLAMEESLLGRDHPDIARTLHDLAWLQDYSGDSAGAVANFQRARTIFIASLGEGALEVAGCEEGLADIALDVGDLSHAYELANHARDIYFAADAGPALISSSESTLGDIQMDGHRYATALAHYEQALAYGRRSAEPLDLTPVHSNIAICLAELGRDAEARNAVAAALASDPSDIERAPAMTVLADLEARAGRFSHAIELGEQVLAMIKNLDAKRWDDARVHVTRDIARWRHHRL